MSGLPSPIEVRRWARACSRFLLDRVCSSLYWSPDLYSSQATSPVWTPAKHSERKVPVAVAVPSPRGRTSRDLGGRPFASAKRRKGTGGPSFDQQGYFPEEFRPWASVDPASADDDVPSPPSPSKSKNRRPARGAFNFRERRFSTPRFALLVNPRQDIVTGAVRRPECRAGDFLV